MTIHALATGVLWKSPEQRTAKSGNPFTRHRPRQGRRCDAMGEGAGLLGNRANRIDALM